MHHWGNSLRLGCPEFYGTVEDCLKEAEMIVFWSSDPDANYGFEGTQRRAWAKELGIKMVHVDPFYNHTAGLLGGKWISPKPGTDAAFAQKQLDAVRQQADHARSILGESLNDMCTMIDRLTERADDLRRESEHAKAVASEVSSDIDQRASAVKGGVERALAEAREQAKTIDTEVSRLIEQGKQTQQTTALAMRVAETTIGQLRAVITQLEPWQGLVASRPGENADDTLAALPEPVRRVIEHTRVELKRDLGSVASALRHLAASADEAGERLVTTTTIQSAESGVSAAQEHRRDANAPGETTNTEAAEPVYYPPLVPVTRVNVQTPVVIERSSPIAH